MDTSSNAHSAQPDAGAPFGLPVLSEVPELVGLLTDLRAVDRLMAGALESILLLEDTGLAEAATGLGLDTWLEAVGRRTAADTRMLRTAARVLRRIPALRAAFASGEASWAQVRSITLAIRPLPEHLDDRIDQAVAEGLEGLAGSEPDALTRAIRWHLLALEPSGPEADQRQAEEQEYLAMQPRLDGSGGRFWGECGPVAWATLDAALNVAARPATGPDQPHPSQTTSGGDPDATTCSGDPDATTNGGSRVARQGRARLARLVDHLERSLSGGRRPGSGGRTAEQRPTTPARSRVQLLLRTDLATLLDRERCPATLLTTVLGGQVRVTAATARRLVEERGADLRTVGLDDLGAVVGVGRRTRIAPGWLSDATLALHDTCSHPGCLTAARRSETDHARPWHPVRPGDPAGRTDIDQLAPICGVHNRSKESDGWIVTQRADGIRRWHHLRSGVTTRTVPATWRPPPPAHDPATRSAPRSEPAA